MNKFKINYWLPTPKKWRIIGDNLLLFSVLASASSAVMDFPNAGIILAIIGILGKFLTNLKFDGPTNAVDPQGDLDNLTEKGN